MPLTLVLGPANSAKAGEVLGAFATATNRGAILVVPTSADAAHYGRELAANGAVLGSVLTFSGLAGEIAIRAGYTGRRLTRLQREHLLEQALATAHFDSLREAAATAGFPQAAGELIAELERSLVTPRRFAAAMRTWGQEDPRRAKYARDVAAIYQAYAARLEQLQRDDAELYAWRALDALRSAPGRWGPEPVYFYGFDDLHPLERDAIETLARVVGTDVTVSLTYEPGREALSARAEVVEELRPLAERVIDLPALGEHYEPQSRAVLHHLERELFEPGTTKDRLEPGEAVQLLEAGGELAEAELVAAEVLELLRAGVPGEEIAVVYRSPELSAALVERVFRRYGIPTALEQRIQLKTTALGRGLLGLARCALEPGRAGADDLLDYLRAPGRLDQPEAVDRLEATVRRRGLRSAEQVRALDRLDLTEIEVLHTAEDPGAELARQARRLLIAPHRSQAPVLDPSEELDARVVAALERALNELEEVGDRPTGNELIELLETLELGTHHAPAAPGAVLVADPLSIRARRFRAVLVCGLQENEFPLRAAPEPFLSDELRRELAACSGLRLRPREDALARERYLFYTSVSRATERVILSYRSSDEEGNLALGSPFIADVAELLAEDWPERRRRRMLADVVWPAASAPTERELARSRAAASAPARGEVPSPIGSLGEAALAHVRHSQILSAGALEIYADCPVRWLVDRELQPAPLEPDSDALARGSYMHTVLEQVLRRLGGPVTPDSLPRALELLDAVLAEHAHGIAAGRGEAVRKGWTRSVAADLRRYLTYEAHDGSDWPIRGVELRFGFDSEEPGSLAPLELDENVRLRGIIDRVDADAEGHAIVRDYKSGSARPEHQGARWKSDRQLQVALYMIAVQELLGLDPVAGFYQPLGGGDMRARGVFLKGAAPGERLVGNDGRNPDELQEVLAEARARALELAGRLRAGSLEPCPATCSRDGCRYPGICRA